ncbi:unnamed protein product [Schistosoma rodhaini]|uniref:Neuropeptide-Like Protein n=1 Tax=Schistosoma rodhaini TaxID=6188 RepID=A0A183R4U3_9TREM|nr:unnamed protein product [Schistosoma rodhaini]
MKIYFTLLIVLYLSVLSTGHMDDDIYQSEHGLYHTYPYMSDDHMIDFLDSKAKHSALETKQRWYPNNLENLDKNKVFYVHRRRFTRPYGR